MNYSVACIYGDGVGPELMNQAIKILRAIGEKYNHRFNTISVTAGGEAIDKYGEPVPEEALKTCMSCDSVLLGNIGGKKWQDNPLEKKPEKTMFILRRNLRVTTNLRPVKLNPYLKECSPLKDEIAEKGIDILMIRDVLGGMLVYDKKTGVGCGGKEASDLEYYNEEIIKKSAKIAFKAAASRKKKLASLDKANVLASSMLWRQTIRETGKDYPDIKLENHLVDNAAMEVIKKPYDFDVIIASNMFGDIIADELSQLTGTASMLGSAELCEDGRGLYTPNQLHYPDESIVGLDKVNPIGMIATTALMLRHSFNLETEATDVETAIDRVVERGIATEDIYKEGGYLVGTNEMGDIIAKTILE